MQINSLSNIFQRNNKQAFTLVELIITIIILAILGTIAFLSFQGYSRDARDSVRISDVSKIKTGFELFVIGNGKYPLPTDATNVTYSGGLVWIQGSYGDQTNTNVESISKLPLDPLTSSEYTYSVTPSRNEYQIAGLVEGGETALNINVNNQANALETKAIALVTGNYNGQVVKSMSGEAICSVLGLPSIISTDTNTTDLEEIITNNKLVYGGYNNLPSSFSGTRFKQEGGFEYNPSTFLMYSDNVGCSDLGNSELERVRLLKNIQDNLKGTILGTNQDYQEVLDINVDEINPNNQSKLISRTLVGNILKVKLQSDSFIALSCDGGITNGYSYPNIAHGAIENVTKTTNIGNGNINHGAQALCNDGEISILNENTNITCEGGYVESGGTCIEDICGGVIPENATSTSTSQSQTKTWEYSTTPGVCSFECNINYTYNSGNNNCEADSQTVSCGGEIVENATSTTPGTYTQIWNGTVWTPVYNWGEDQIYCDFECDTNYSWNGENCEGNLQTVSFDANGGTGHTPTSKSVTYNTAIGSLPTNPTREGYTFNGWYTQASGGTEITTSTVITGNTTYYAQWSINSYTVTFDGNGGTGHTPTSKSVTYNTAIGSLPTNPTRTGYTFNGWYTATTGGSQITTATLVSGDATVYAQWSINSYTVTFDGNGGTGHTPTSKSVTYNTAIGSLPTNPTRTGYTFNGWYTATTGGTQVTISTVITTNTTVYAQWSINSYTVTFDGNGGTGHIPTSKSVVNNTAVGTLPTDPIRTGYTFNGWYTASTGGEQVTISTVVTTNVTYYAQWSINSYTVNFDGNGGTDHTPTSMSVVYNTAVGTLPTNPTRSGYTFNGWYTATSGGTQVTIATLVTGNATVYAQWSIRNYTVTFNANGGTGHTPTTKSVVYNTEVGTLPTDPTRAGYTFTGWFTASSGGTQVTTATVVTANVTYYAQWYSSYSTVTFDSNGGSTAVPATKTVLTNTEVGTLPTTTMEGYILDGWFTSKYAGRVQVTSSTVITGDLTYYAMWTPGIVITSCNTRGEIINNGTSFGTCSTNDKIVCTGYHTGLIIAGCNVGSSTASGYGYYFQWGRNKGFNYPPSYTSTKISGTVGLNASTDTYGFVNGSGLTSWASTTITSNWGGKTGNSLARKGPCEDGYHVPTADEWDELITAGGWSNSVNMSSVIPIPLAGRIYFNTPSRYFDGIEGYYWASTYSSSNGDYFTFNASGINDTNSYPSYGQSVRCFKN